MHAPAVTMLLPFTVSDSRHFSRHASLAHHAYAVHALPPAATYRLRRHAAASARPPVYTALVIRPRVSPPPVPQCPMVNKTVANTHEDGIARETTAHVVAGGSLP